MHVTHTFNVMTFHHRACGLANVALCRKFPKHDRRFRDVLVPTVEVIADMQHVDSLTIQSLLDARGVTSATTTTSPFDGKHSVSIISDAIAGPDATVGTKLLYGPSRAAWVQERRQRKSVVDENGVLCGSCDAVGLAFQRLVRVLGLSVSDASRLCSSNPARVARLDHIVGTLERGKRADIVLLDSELNITTTIISGNVAYKESFF